LVQWGHTHELHQQSDLAIIVSRQKNVGGQHEVGCIYSSAGKARLRAPPVAYMAHGACLAGKQ